GEQASSAVAALRDGELRETTSAAASTWPSANWPRSGSTPGRPVPDRPQCRPLLPRTNHLLGHRLELDRPAGCRAQAAVAGRDAQRAAAGAFGLVKARPWAATAASTS